MSCRPLFTDLRLVLAFLPFLFLVNSAHAQSVVLHLHDGERIAGTIISETPTAVTLSNSWVSKLVVPLAQVEKREYPAGNATTTVASATNALPKTMPTNGFMIVSIVPEPLKTNDWRKRWKGELSVGTDLERGATDHQLSYGKAKLTYEEPYDTDPKQFFRDTLNYDAEYGKTDGTLSDNRMSGSSKTELDVNRKYYVYNLGAAGYDKLQLIDLHYEDGPGAGYHWITQTNLAVNLEAGANYQSDLRSDDTRISEGYYRLGQNLTWKLNKQVALSQKYEYFPQADNPKEYRMRFESNLSCTLLLNFCLNFTVVDLYDTRPALTVPNNDLQLRTSLGWKF